MDQVKNGVLYLRYRSDFVITTAERYKSLQTKPHCYPIAKITLRVLLTSHKPEKIEHEKSDFVLSSFFLSFFVLLRHT